MQDIVVKKFKIFGKWLNFTGKWNFTRFYTLVQH